MGYFTYNAPISKDVTGYDSHMAKPEYTIKNKNGTTTKYYDGSRSRETTSRSLKDYVHGRQGKTKETHSEGTYVKVLRQAAIKDLQEYIQKIKDTLAS